MPFCQRFALRQAESRPNLVVGALENIKGKGGIKPTFMVNIYEKCDEKLLMGILIELKKMVADSNVSHGFVVMSTSRATLLLPVTSHEHELRVCPVSVSDPPKTAIVEYLENTWLNCFRTRN